MKTGVVKFGQKFAWVLSLVLAAAQASPSFAGDVIPVCPDRGRPLPINNEQVLNWKFGSPNQFKARGHIRGSVLRVYADHSGHDHFSIRIGQRPQDTIEVIYNQDFGALPERLNAGSTVEACGDFIVSNAPSGPYPASPDGAIIHWVHVNPSGQGHDSGYLVIDGDLYGMDASNAGPPPKYGKGGKNNQRGFNRNGNGR